MFSGALKLEGGKFKFDAAVIRRQMQPEIWIDRRIKISIPGLMVLGQNASVFGDHAVVHRHARQQGRRRLRVLV